MKLFETSFGDTIDCPACGYYGATTEQESRADFEDENYPGYPFDTFSYCPLCGWTQYEMEDEDIWFEIAADKGLDLEDEFEIENALPPNPLESLPDRKELAVAKEVIAKVLDFVPDIAGKPMAEFIFSDWSNFNVRTLESFKRGFLLYIFEKLR